MIPAPSTIRGGDAPPSERTWPQVIGIIAIIFASLALLQHGFCAPVGMVMSRLGEGLLESVGQSSGGAVEVQQAQLDVIGRYTLPMIVSTVCSFAVALLLLFGGIALVRRRASSPRTIRTWAGLKMLVAIGVAALNYDMGQAQFEAMAQAAAESPDAPGQMPAGIYSLLQGFGTIGAVLGMLWLWALPVFMIVWFARPSIRSEVREWGSAADAPPDVPPDAPPA